MRHIRILRRNGHEPVAAELHEMGAKDLFLAERSWTEDRSRILAELLRRDVPRTRWPESLHWDWAAKADELRRLSMSTTQFGIYCEGRWQGLMMTKTAPHTARIQSDAGKPVVYVEFVEAAPWNWSLLDVGQERVFLAIGSTLIKVAVEQSLREGFHARVGLHSLPQSEGFYDAIGMTRYGRDTKKEELVYFEFSRENAERFLKSGSRP